MTDRRCYVTELERKVSRQKRRIKELEKQNAGWREAVDRQEALLQLRQNLINQREGERDEYKNMCEEYEGEVADLGNKIDQLEGELRTVVDREHAIHNESAAGMIDRIKELEKQIFDWKRVADQKAERIKELQQANSTLLQELEYTKALLAQHVAAAGDRPTSLERDFTSALNYWGADSDLDTADFILANFLIRQLHNLKGMKRAEREHGISPTRVVSHKPTALDQKVMLRNARLASISIDDDGLGTFEVKE